VSSGSRSRRKRERAASWDERDESSALNLPLTTLKLPARTLLYQLVILRSDEEMVVRGVERRSGSGGSVEGIDVRVRTAAEMEQLQVDRGEEEEARKHHAVKVQNRVMMDGDEKEEKEEKYNDWVDKEAVLSELSEGAPQPDASTSASFFPESSEFVDLLLSASACHNHFIQRQTALERRGVRRVKERMIEWQLTEPIKLLLIHTETQRNEWRRIDLEEEEEEATSMHDENFSNSLTTTSFASPMPLRASPFDKPMQIQQTRPRSSSSSSTLPSTAASSAASLTPAVAPSLPSLIPSPILSPSLASVLSAHESDLAGFCMSSHPNADPSNLAPNTRNVLDGRVTLRSTVCAHSLHLLDDDKKGGWSQQLLTDLFSRMEMGQKRKQDRRAHRSPFNATSNAAASFASANGYGQSASGPTVILSPSSFSSALRQQPFDSVPSHCNDAEMDQGV